MRLTPTETRSEIGDLLDWCCDRRDRIHYPPIIAGRITRLITITAGSYSNVIRVLVPLVATNEQMDEGLDVLESALAAVSDKKGAVAQLV